MNDFICFESLRKGVSSVDTSSSDKETVQHQFDTLAKKILRGEAKSYQREIYKRAEHQVLFGEMNDIELEQLYTEDEYPSDMTSFLAYGYEVLIHDELLADALHDLSDKKRDIILLSYCLDMSDEEIGRLLNIVRSTVFRNRKAALEVLKKYMEGK